MCLDQLYIYIRQSFKQSFIEAFNSIWKEHVCVLILYSDFLWWCLLLLNYPLLTSPSFQLLLFLTFCCCFFHFILFLLIHTPLAQCLLKILPLGFQLCCLYYHLYIYFWLLFTSIVWEFFVLYSVKETFEYF